MESCAKKYNINASTVMSRCISPHFEEWDFVDQKHKEERSYMYYKKVSSRHKRKREKTKEKLKPVYSVDGVLFFTFKDGERKLGCHTETIQRRCVDENYEGWEFLTEELYNKYLIIVKKRIEKDRLRERVYQKKK